MGMSSFGARRAMGVLSARVVGVLAAVVGLLGLGAFALVGEASGAGSPCGTNGQFSQSGTTVTCTYATPGSEDTFTVPAGVNNVSVTAIGAPGGGAFDGGGGRGAKVSNTALPVPPGAGLWVDVGSTGGAVPVCAPPFGTVPGGSFDGGTGWGCAGGGGGSSALLRMQRASATLTGNPATDSRLLVAGGGGGGGFEGGGSAGAAVIGAGAGGCVPPRQISGGAGGVGPTDGADGGGAGGCTDDSPNSPGGAGTAAMGGSGAHCGDLPGGAGGGGGWFGGGGGGGCHSADFGGGGGSSYGGTGSPGGISIAAASSTEAPEVMISYTLRASDLASKLVIDADHLAPGKALAHKAAAIQTAVNAGHTATACADITDFLGLVKAQTGKKLSTTKAMTLRTDAMNLQFALGC